jgi:hypothetical protein
VAMKPTKVFFYSILKVYKTKRKLTHFKPTCSSALIKLPT